MHLGHEHKHYVVMNSMSVVCVVAGHVPWLTAAMPQSENVKVIFETTKNHVCLTVAGRSNILVHEDHRKSPHSSKDVGMGKVIKEL